MIVAGKLRHYGTVEHFVETGSGKHLRGNKRGEWRSLHSDVPFQVTPLSGRLAEIKRQLVPTASHTLRLRHLDQVKAGMRVRLEERYFNIGYISEGDFKQHELEFVCTEVAGETTNG